MMKYDVLMVGAGLNGLTTALAMGGRRCRTPLRVALVDRVDPVGFAINRHDSRASAITTATQAMMRGLGVWDMLQPQAQNMTKITVTDSTHPNLRPSLLTFLADDESDAPAALIENATIFQALLSEVAASPTITLMAPVQISAVQFGPGLARLILESGEDLTASLIIGADGRNSPTRVASGIGFEGWDYPQSAITLTVGHDLPHQGQAEEHFTPSGVFAILPLKGNRASLVWTEPHARAQEICALPDAEFLAVLSQQFGSHRGPLQILSPRHAYPLSMMMAQSFTARRLALVGDAAHVVHPLAGLGLNLGFKDAAALADCVMNAQSLGLDIGGAGVLESYQRWRRFDTISTAALLDGLNQLFANDHAALRLLRQAGLRLVDIAKPLKDQFMREAAGGTGDLPRLMRGLAA